MKAFLFLFVISCSPPISNVGKAEYYANIHGHIIFDNELSFVQCEQTDSDRNGRSVCNIFKKKSSETVTVECPSNWLPQFENLCVVVDNVKVRK
jgi:hypothetical protein